MQIYIHRDVCCMDMLHQWHAPTTPKLTPLKRKDIRGTSLDVLSPETAKQKQAEFEAFIAAIATARGLTNSQIIEVTRILKQQEKEIAERMNVVQAEVEALKKQLLEAQTPKRRDIDDQQDQDGLAADDDEVIFCKMFNRKLRDKERHANPTPARLASIAQTRAQNREMRRVHCGPAPIAPGDVDVVDLTLDEVSDDEPTRVALEVGNGVVANIGVKCEEAQVKVESPRFGIKNEDDAHVKKEIESMVNFNYVSAETTVSVDNSGHNCKDTSSQIEVINMGDVPRPSSSDGEAEYQPLPCPLEAEPEDIVPQQERRREQIRR